MEPTVTTDDRLFIRFKGRIIGPLTLAEAKNLVRRGQISQLHEVSADSVNWQPAREFEQLFPPAKLQTRPVEEVKIVESELKLESPSTRQTTLKDRSSEPSGPKPVSWYVEVDGNSEGPMDDAQLRQWIKNGRITRKTLLWREGMVDWQAAEICIDGAFQSASRQSGDAGSDDSPSSEIGLLHEIATEYCRARPWVLFLGVTFVVLAVLQFLGIVFAIVTAAGANNSILVLYRLMMLVPTLMVLQLGMLKIYFSQSLNTLRYQPSGPHMLRAIRASVRYWRTFGIVMAVLLILGFLATLLVALVIAFAGGAALNS